MPMKRHTMIAWMEDKPGVLNRVAGLFRRRNFNIESLAVGHSETPGISRMTFVARGTDRDMRQIQTQLDKLINVVDIQDVTNEPVVMRELVLVKVQASNGNRSQVMQIVDIYRASIIDVDLDSMIVQIVGPEDRVESFVKLLSNFGIAEMVRTGRVAMVRGGKSEKQVQMETAVLGHSNGNQQ
ncbi:MAG: acetolactate synthase small subunit [Chloroflexi bacterium]|nr:acetolactate synthase small subunit [Chloroflexota bacterium]MBK6712698.1 acetolactate synthase small subunit [Chloroflexota bacterium]MBK7177843.1 acetolactate synthase small subunit [Chloroflexota bacterium]MBK7916216.1 acetolactate synthase small subunit [Chloroflexota bacterium]MBK8930801.1 acetolactate synthase small subunit [Chloroflexota bacterium]